MFLENHSDFQNLFPVCVNRLYLSTRSAYLKTLNKQQLFANKINNK